MRPFQDPGMPGEAARFRFGEFEFDPANASLRKGAVGIRLRPQALRILGLLVSRAGQLVTRDEIRRQIWSADTFVDFNQGLNVCIRQLREALEDLPESPRYIETVPRLGYRFVAPVDRVGAEERRESAPAARDQAPAAERAVAADTASVAPPAAVEVVRPRRSSWRDLTSRRSMALLLAVILAVAGVSLWQTHWQPSGPARRAIRSLAVLPLVNLSDNIEHAYVADGITEALINDLAQLRGLRVISRTSAMQYRNSNKSLPDIARELAVDAVVEGSIAYSGERVRISAQLVDGRTDEPLWANSYDRSVGDVLALQREISDAIVTEIQAELTPEERARRERQRSIDPRAYEAFLKGRYFWNQRTREGFDRAIEFFGRAIELEPTYAAAYAGLADCYVLGAGAGLPPHEIVARARRAAMKAVELDELLGEAHASLGFIRLVHDWDLPGAESSLRRAIELNPGYPSARAWHAEYLMVLGRFQEAIAEMQRAQQLDPLALIITRDTGRIYYYAGDPDQAISYCRKVLALDPAYVSAHATMAFAFDEKREFEAALRHLDEMSRLSPRSRRFARTVAGRVHARAGDRRRALEILKEVSAPGDRAPAFYIAALHTALGQRTEAFTWLEKAYAERSYWLVYLAVEPLFRELRSDPRFADLTQRIGIRPMSTSPSRGFS